MTGKIDDLKRLYSARGNPLSEREANLNHEAWRMAEGVSQEAAAKARESGFARGIALGLAVGSLTVLGLFIGIH